MRDLARLSTLNPISDMCCVCVFAMSICVARSLQTKSESVFSLANISACWLQTITNEMKTANNRFELKFLFVLISFSFFFFASFFL